MLSSANVAVCFMPIEVLPHIYKYGYAFPFYNVSGAVRTILFGTKNQRMCSPLCDIAYTDHFLSGLALWRSYCMDGHLALHAPAFPVEREENDGLAKRASQMA